MFAPYATNPKSQPKVDEEMQSLQLDRPTGGKSAVQMQRHTVDEQMQAKPIERSLYILTKGDDLQKLSVIQSLPDLLNIDNQATITRIIPKIQQELPKSSSEFHIATSQMFRLLIEMRVSLNLIRPVMQGTESKDTIVAAAWIETLISVIPFMNESILKNEVLPFVTKMTNLNRLQLYRIASCKLLGLISVHPKVNPFEVKRDILPLVQSLCQDCMLEVRAAMCSELPHIAQGLSNDIVIKANLLPCLVELSSDENVAVRSAAVCSVAVLIPYLSSETVKTTIIPLVQKLCLQSVTDGDQTFPSVAKVYGTLLTNLQPHLNGHTSVWFLQFVKQLSQRDLNEKEGFDGEPTLLVRCRESCAENLPPITYFMITLIPTELSKWTSMFKSLACDPCYIVRKMVAGNIHEVAKILRKECKIIVTDFLKLLRDESEEVLDALVPNVSRTLEVFTISSILSRDATTQLTLEVGRALLKCQIEVFKWHNWRRMMVFLQQLEYLPFYMPADFIHQHFTPVILKLILEARAKPVRGQAARTLLFFLRYCTKDNHRRWIRDNLVNMVCHSQSCYTRHIFIMMCSDAIQIFSWKYFKEHFFLHLLSLGDDPVSTVRLCVVNMCPTLKQMLNLPMDKTLQGKLEGVLTKLEMTERDRDVIAALKLKTKDMRAMTMYHTDMFQLEKQKQDEEEKILQGRSFGSSLVTRPMTSSQYISPAQQVESSTTGSPKPREGSERSRGLQYPPNHMTFLHKHFYTDAGVDLPRIEPQSLDKGLSELTLSTTEANLTDDLKANLKRIGGEVTMRKNKRNSCVFPGERTVARNVKRYSLNGNLEGSRIPVRNNGKSGGAKEVKEKENRPASRDDGNKITTKASNLPVLRKSYSDFKKYSL